MTDSYQEESHLEGDESEELNHQEMQVEENQRNTVPTRSQVKKKLSSKQSEHKNAGESKPKATSNY